MIMSEFIYENNDVVKQSIRFTDNAIVVFTKVFGKESLIASCELQDIVRIVKDISMLENKAKYLIYYSKNGKEKRLGGMAFSIEGNAIDSKFQQFVALLEASVPKNTIWQDKASAKAMSTTKMGVDKFPIAGNMYFLFMKMPSHAGMRKVIAAMHIIAAFFSALIVLMLLIPLVLSDDLLTSALVFLIIAVPLGAYATLVLRTAFLKSGLFCALLTDTDLQINYAVQSKAIPFNAIEKFSNRIVQLGIVQNGARSSSVQYEFQVNNVKFIMGENAAQIFIEKAKSKGLVIL